MTALRSVDASLVTASLGPTNTGKTHHAVSAMLEHETGMIGLPLRLLAREVYDRVTARIGEREVALVTGEEKRVPPRPRYWVCTVEAMPTDREVDFVALDEVQLAAHPQRGHVFTDRVLRLRGRRETHLLGSHAAAGILSELVPTARVVSRPRLSTLSFAGAHTLSRLPPRSAIVTFSMDHVYRLAELVRRKRGGAAVVLGALSPRTRNAQVAMFQAGEVDVLVATDAIGMGLNLDVHHVAFASLGKFDGNRSRGLDAAELAQIAGRAGRHTRDGTFGALAPLALPEPAARSIEAHEVEPLRRVFWRSGDLDLSSVDALLASLREPPRRRVLVRAEPAEDEAALEVLARDPEIRALARGPEGAARLWDVCQIPDYRKLLFEEHLRVLREIFVRLSAPPHRLGADYLRREIDLVAELASGDVDTLVGALAAIRTWTYVTQRRDWVEHPEAFQARTREVEDRLSDALHERLVQRFVERGARAASGRAARAPAPPGSHPFAALAARLAPEAEVAAAPSALELLVDAPHEALSLDADARVRFAPAAPKGSAARSGDLDGALVGRLVRGADLLRPEVKVELEGVTTGERARVLRRLQAYARDAVAELLAPLRTEGLARAGGAARGLIWQLERGLGAAPRERAAEQLAALDEADARALDDAGVVLGERWIFSLPMTSPEALGARAALVRAWLDLSLGEIGRATVSARGAGEAALTALGYARVGEDGLAVRIDRLERVLAAARTGALPPRDVLGAWLGCRAAKAERIARGLC